MSSEPLILSHCANDVATITLNRPEKRNALNEAMWVSLADTVRKADALSGAKVIIIRGAGGHFAAGADISEFEIVYATRERSAQYRDAVEDGARAITDATKPVIAMIEGACVGGGMAIALACDLRMAANSAKCGITPAKLGIVYGFDDTRRLVEIVGPSKAKDILFTGHIMDAAEAVRIGLLDELHPHQELERAVAAKCALIAGNSQWSVRGAKKTIRHILSGGVESELANEFLNALAQADFREGRAAFMEKRPPKFPFR